MYQILFTRQREVREYRDLAKCDLAKYAALHVELFHHGVMIDEDNMECFFTCEDHSDEDLERTIAAFHTALADVNAGRLHTPEAATSTSAHLIPSCTPPSMTPFRSSKASGHGP